MKAWKHVIFTRFRFGSGVFFRFWSFATICSLSSHGRRLAAQREAKKQNSVTTVKPWPIFNWVHGSLFHMESSASKAHSSYFDSLFTSTPTTPSANPADGGSFVHEHPGNNFKGCNAGCKCGVAKNKTKLKNREAPEGTGDIHSSTLKRGEREKSYCVP